MKKALACASTSVSGNGNAKVDLLSEDGASVTSQHLHKNFTQVWIPSRYMIRAASYARVSSDVQKLEGTIESHSEIAIVAALPYIPRRTRSERFNEQRDGTSSCGNREDPRVLSVSYEGNAIAATTAPVAR